VTREHPTTSKQDTPLAQFDDLLVLHLVKGRDHFITVGGKFQYSTFGLPLNQIIENERNKYTSKGVDCLLIDLSDVSTGQHEDTVAMPPIDGVPRHLWLLVERCRAAGLEQNALADDAVDFAVLRDYLDAYLPPSDMPTLPLSSYVNCIKKFISAIVDGVITQETTMACLHSSAHHVHPGTMLECVSRLEVYHLATFIYIIKFLRDLVAHSSTNDMNSITASGLFADAMFAKLNNEEEKRRAKTFIQRAIDTKEF